MLRKVDVDTLKGNYMHLHEESLAQLRYSKKSPSTEFCEYGLMSFHLQSLLLLYRELAQTMRFYAPIDCIRGRFGFLSFNDTLIREYLAYLSPETVRIDITSPDFEEDADRTEPW